MHSYVITEQVCKFSYTFVNENCQNFVLVSPFNLCDFLAATKGTLAQFLAIDHYASTYPVILLYTTYISLPRNEISLFLYLLDF